MLARTTETRGDRLAMETIQYALRETRWRIEFWRGEQRYFYQSKIGLWVRVYPNQPNAIGPHALDFIRRATACFETIQNRNNQPKEAQND